MTRRKGVSDLAHATTYMPVQHGGLRKEAVQNIVIHHAAGVINGHALGGFLQNPGHLMTANYGIGTDGVIVSSLPEQYRPWTTSGADPDERSITIEVGNSDGGPNWPISKAAMQSLIKLVADIARRYGWSQVTYTGDKTGTLLMHKWYAATSCPGPYLSSKFGYIRDEVNKLLKADRAEATKPGAAQGKTVDELAREVIGGKWSNDPERSRRLTAAGHDAKAVQRRVGELMGKPGKTLDELAREVIGGKWGNDPERTRRLTAAGHDAKAVQKRVNELLGKPSKTLDELAREVLAGQWSNDPERTRRLTAAGHDAKAVQRRVNELLGKPGKTLDELAREVLAGQWGNDPERTRRLTAAGHDAKAVQKRVNELLR